jgi:hypothetical protein
MQDTTTTLLNLILPPGCTCENVEPKTYCITCNDFDTAQWVWNKRVESIYPLLKKGEMLEVKGNEFQIKSYPKP